MVLITIDDRYSSCIYEQMAARGCQTPAEVLLVMVAEHECCNDDADAREAFLEGATELRKQSDTIEDALKAFINEQLNANADVMSTLAALLSTTHQLAAKHKNLLGPGGLSALSSVITQQNEAESQ